MGNNNNNNKRMRNALQLEGDDLIDHMLMMEPLAKKTKVQEQDSNDQFTTLLGDNVSLEDYFKILENEQAQNDAFFPFDSVMGDVQQQTMLDLQQQQQQEATVDQQQQQQLDQQVPNWKAEEEEKM